VKRAEVWTASSAAYTVTTGPRTKPGACLGRLDDADIRRLDRALLVFLGLAR
jgi:hypothetical protein